MGKFKFHLNQQKIVVPRAKIGVLLSNGHSRQIGETCALLAQMWRGESHFSQKWPLANVGESGESSHGTLANLANLANFYARLFYVQKKIFLCIK
jgi:hypothetical protein